MAVLLQDTVLQPCRVLEPLLDTVGHEVYPEHPCYMDRGCGSDSGDSVPKPATVFDYSPELQLWAAQRIVHTPSSVHREQTEK